MGTYVVTGSASGIGAATTHLLEDEGHTVIGVDVLETTVRADLSTPQGRADAVTGIRTALRGGHLDGIAAVAGAGAHLDDPGKVLAVNYFAPVAVLEGLRRELAAGGEGRAVVVSSNSAGTAPLIDETLVRTVLTGDEEAALERARGRHIELPEEIAESAPSITAYASSKLALSLWVRRTAVTAEWAREGLLLNAVAPGAVLSPSVRSAIPPDTDPDNFPTPIPLGVFGQPEDVAFWVHQFLRPQARFTTGTVLYVDGGTDAAMRPEGSPLPLAPPEEAGAAEDATGDGEGTRGP